MVFAYIYYAKTIHKAGLRRIIRPIYSSDDARNASNAYSRPRGTSIDSNVTEPILRPTHTPLFQRP